MVIREARKKDIRFVGAGLQDRKELGRVIYRILASEALVPEQNCFIHDLLVRAGKRRDQQRLQRLEQRVVFLRLRFQELQQLSPCQSYLAVG